MHHDLKRLHRQPIELADCYFRILNLSVAVATALRIDNNHSAVFFGQQAANSLQTRAGAYIYCVRLRAVQYSLTYTSIKICSHATLLSDQSVWLRTVLHNCRLYAHVNVTMPDKGSTHSSPTKHACLLLFLVAVCPPKRRVTLSLSYH